MPQPETSRKKTRPRTVLILLLALCIAAGWLIWTKRNAPLPVMVERLAPGPVSLVLALNGRTAAEAEVEIKPAVTAHADAVLVQEGDRVQRGQLLVQLDPNLVEAQRDQAQAALEVQEARQAQAASAARRAEGLRANAISKSDLEAAELALATASGEVIRLKAALKEVERELTRYDLRAPLDGIVLERNVDPGQLVGPQESLMLIADPAKPLIETDVDELYANRIAVGQKVLLQPVGQQSTLAGVVRYVAPRIDLTTGGRKVEINFEAPDNLPLGLTVSSNIIVEDHEAALTLPRSALLETGGILVVEAGRAVLRHVDYIDWPAERVIITAGLEAGAEVITAPEGIIAGDRVAAR